jgi:hypothetical protein
LIGEIQDRDHRHHRDGSAEERERDGVQPVEGADDFVRRDQLDVEQHRHRETEATAVNTTSLTIPLRNSFTARIENRRFNPERIEIFSSLGCSFLGA